MFLDIFNNNEKMYIRISESYRVYSEEKKKFVNRKRTIKNIGPVSKFDDGKENFIERLRASFNAGTPIIKELEPYVSKDIKKEVYNIQIHEGTEECIGHPKLFSNLLLDKLMEEIGLTQYINVYKTYDKITYDVLGFIKLLIYGRLLNPASKIATVNQNDDYYNKIIDDGSYKYNVFDSLDFIYKHKNAFFNRIDQTLRKKVGRTTNIIYYDVTNFFIFTEDKGYECDDEGTKIYHSIATNGVCKEERKLPIVQMGLLMDEQGIPISIEVFPGNTLDHLTMQKSFNNSVDFIKDKNNRYIFVSDKGIGRGGNPKFSIENGNGYLVSKSVRGSTKAEKKWIISDEDFVYNTDDFKIKTKTYTKTYTLENGTELKSSEKIVSYWSKKFYTREYEEQKSFYDTLKQIIENPESFPSNRLNNSKIKKYLKKQVLNDETGEIIDSENLKAIIDIDKVNEELSLLGWYSIITSETNMDENEIIETYHNLVDIEDQFRVMKSTLETRPLYVRTDEHRIAHLTLCTIALILLRLIQRAITNKFNDTLSADRIQVALNKWKVEKLADEHYRFNDIDDKDLKLIFDSFDIKLPVKLYKPIDFRLLKNNIKIS
jgi:hypothetical protein